LTKFEIARAKSSGFVKQINRILVNSLGADNRHLYEADTDIDPRHEAFWFVGGIEPTKQVKAFRKKRDYLKRILDEPVDRPFQYVGTPFLALRHQYPLEPFAETDFNAADAPKGNVPSVTIDPRSYSFYTEHRHGVSTPGFWPGNVREYGLVSYQDRKFMNSRRNHDYGAEDAQNALHSQGIVTSYAWLLAQACYQGFSTYLDMTYPLTTQTVITDGKFWSFYKYQLNTTCIHTNLDGPNPKYNQCWGTPEMKLYDEIDDEGKMQGFNEDVLKNLVQFYVNQPKPREHEMKPYLGKDKKIADIEDVKQRDWLEKCFKRLVSNRPRHLPLPEIYNWEWIYKINNNTRPLDRRLRFFELGINPFARRLNEHQPKYIPRHLRARGPHDKKKFEATYYPLNHKMNIPREQSHSQVGAPRDKHANTMDVRRKSYK
jgi:small subunit ribosomal protein S30